MCGIVGIVNLDFKPVQFDTLKRMSDIQKHRGPDDQGFADFSFQQENIKHYYNGVNKGNSALRHGALGFNRLSILDLSLSGHQPMISENGKVAIVYNGETYNAFQFKPDLEKKGCIVDVKLKKIFLARDHAGIKPLYWYKNNNTILFASEIKTFLMHPNFDAAIEKSNIDEYLFYKYNAFDRTIFKGVHQVPAGHYLEISKTEIKLKKYWEPKIYSSKLNKNQALDQLEKWINNRVKSQL